MSFIIFLIVLGVLVFVHELGHFLAAKKAKVRVDEFGFGYPPRAKVLGKKWGTLFTLNWIPFGGFVKIFGEDYEDQTPPTPPLEQGREKTNNDVTVTEVESISLSEKVEGEIFTEELIKITEVVEVPSPGQGEDYAQVMGGVKSFAQISKKWQAAILASGVLFNILFAWLLFSFGFMIGLPTSVENNYGGTVQNSALTITEVVPNSPAQKAGLKSGDKIKSVSSENGSALKELSPDNVAKFTSNSGEVFIQIERGGEILDFKIIPQAGIEEGRKIIGVGTDMVGTLKLPIHKAFYEGGRTAFEITHLTIDGVAGLIKGAVVGKADISQVSGPVGIIGLVGDASRLGFAYLITFAALISINLAIVNLIPFPALDGGRIVFVIFEGITGKKINPKFASTLNTIGFIILIILMLVVTYRDILKLF